MSIWEGYVGKLFDDRYEFLNLLGQGAWSEVVRAFDKLRSHHVAVKLLKDPVGHDVLGDRFFREEFRAMTQIRHPNIVQVKDFGQSPEGIRYYTMELIDGEPLSKHRGDPRGKSLENILEGLCRALAAVHAKGCLHCDVKPDNVMLVSKGNTCSPILMDFGLNIDVSSETDAAPRGTPVYAAPEMLAGQQIDLRADLYSLGVTILEVITGEAPYGGLGSSALLSAKATTSSVKAHISKVPKRYREIVAKMIAPDPRDRFPSCLEVLRALATTGKGDLDLPPPTPVHSSLLRPDLMGRDEEMGAIYARIDQLRKRNGGSILLEGPRRSGKTRLLEEARYYAQLSGAMVISAGNDISFARKRSLSWALDRAMALRTSPERDAQGQEKIVQRTARLASERPLLILVDDLHDLDASSIALWCALAHRSRKEGYLILASATPTRSPKDSTLDLCLNMVSDDPELMNLRIGNLNEEQIEGLCRSMLGTSDNVVKLACFLMSRTGGNVGACVDLLTALAREDHLKHRLGEWSVKPTASDKIGKKRSTSRIVGRLNSLAPGLQKVLLAAAVSGARASASIVQRASALAEDEFAERILELENMGVLSWETIRSGAFVRFTDPTLPEELIERADKKLIAQLCDNAANVLMERRANDQPYNPVQLIEHLSRAERLEEGLQIAMTEGKRHEAEGDLSLGVSLLTFALKLAEDLSCLDVLQLAQLNLSIARMLRLQAEGDEALRHCERALRQLQETNATDTPSGAMLAVELHEETGLLCERASEHEQAIEHYSSALQLLGDHPTQKDYKRKWMQLKNSVSWALMLAHRYSESERALREVLDGTDIDDLPAEKIGALNTVGWLNLYRGKLHQGLKSFRQGLSIAKRRSVPVSVKMQSLNGAASASWLLGRWKRALSYYQQGCNITEGLDPATRCKTIGNLAVAEYQMGKLESAETHFRQILDSIIEVGNIDFYVVTLHNLGTLLMAQGRNDEALKHLQKAQKIAHRKHYERHILLIEGNLGELLLNARKYERAEPLLRKVLQRARRKDYGDLLPEAYRRMARLSLEQGSGQRFNYYAKRCEEYAQRVGEKHELLYIDRLRARHFMLSGHLDKAGNVFSRVAESFESMGASFEEALTRLEWAELALKQDKVSLAEELLSRVETLVNEAGATRVMTKVKDLKKQTAQKLGWSRRIRHVLEAFDRIRLSEHVESALQTIAETMVSITGADRGLIMSFNQRGMIQFEASANFLGTPPGHLRVSSTVVKNVTESHKPLLLRSVAADVRFTNSASIQNLQMGSIVCVPVFVHNALQGVLYLDSKRPNTFDEDRHLPLAELIAHQAGFLLENVRMRDENRLIEELVSALAHEMRTPLNAILSSVELMAMPTKKPPSHYVGVVKGQVSRLSRLADETIDLVKQKASAQILRREPINMNSLIWHTVEALEPLAKKNEISLKLNLRNDLQEIEGQRDALEQVLINLVTNATKYTGPGGTIQIVSDSTTIIYDPTASASSYVYLGHPEQHWQGSFVTISIIDDGEGMEQDECMRIFEKYTRSRKAEANGRIKGSGLGLYICRSIVEQHGGRIWATSAKGKGTKVAFTLPVSPQ